MSEGKYASLVGITFLALFAAMAVFDPKTSHSQTSAPVNYIVLYKTQSVPTDAGRSIKNAGGTVVKSYDAIGVVIASSANSSFRDTLLRDSRIEGAAATAGFAVRLNPTTDDGLPSDLANTPASDTDSLSGLQWDMRQIHSPEAHAITGGSSSVLVGVIDTGVDYTHPDLAPNFDFNNSCSCVGGVPNQTPGAFNDDNGHGTHGAGIIAAASNGIGIVGVAPYVRIASIKAANVDGFIFPEAVICSFMWAASHPFSVTNNSYFADPWLFNCRNDPEQRAIWKAEQRAIRYAMTQGVTVVAAMGNFSDDLARPQVDLISPDFPPGSAQEREITNACLQIPVEIPGVIGVSADGNAQQDTGGYLKSFYSNYGIGVTEVVAPGGDSIFGLTAAAPNGRVLSTWPAALINNCPPSRRVIDASGAVYCFQQGTSPAAPHASGVAALIVSRFGNLLSAQKMPAGQVAAFLLQTASPQPCPNVLPTGYDAFTRPSGDPQKCEGGRKYNSWYGSGQVDALNAVTFKP